MSCWRKFVLLLNRITFLKSKVFWKFVGKRAGIVVFCLALLVLAVLFKGIADVIVAIASSIIILVIAFDLFSLLIIYEKRIRLKEISNSSVEIDEDLFNWSGTSELSDELIHGLFSKENPEKSMSSLFALKEKIETACSKDKNNYYMLKRYIELKNKDIFSRNTRSVLVAAIIGAVVTIVTQLNSEENILLVIQNFIMGSDKELKLSSLTTYITFCTYGLIALMAFLVLKGIFIKSKSRLRMISIVVDSCIYDIKEE